MRLHFSLFLVLYTTSGVFCQDRIAFEGAIFDRQTGGPIPGVNVFIRGEKVGAISDTAGKFHLAVPSGRQVTVVLSHIAYQKVTRTMRFDQSPTSEYRVFLDPDTLKLQEFVIWGVKPIVISEPAKRRARYTLTESDFEHLGEPDMDKALQYLLPYHVKPLVDRMTKPELDFTLYVNGEWKESMVLRDIDPYAVRRVMVWEMLGPERNIDSRGRDAGYGKNVDIFPLGMPLRSGRYVISVETKQ